MLLRRPPVLAGVSPANLPIPAADSEPDSLRHVEERLLSAQCLWVSRVYLDDESMEWCGDVDSSAAFHNPSQTHFIGNKAMMMNYNDR